MLLEFYSLYQLLNGDKGGGGTKIRNFCGRYMCMAPKTEICRVDIDDEEGLLHHIKVSNAKDFGLWLEQLKQHRLFQQHQVVI